MKLAQMDPREAGETCYMLANGPKIAGRPNRRRAGPGKLAAAVSQLRRNRPV
jgi:hypothetical protein